MDNLAIKDYELLDQNFAKYFYYNFAYQKPLTNYDNKNCHPV